MNQSLNHILLNLTTNYSKLIYYIGKQKLDSVFHILKCLIYENYQRKEKRCGVDFNKEDSTVLHGSFCATLMKARTLKLWSVNDVSFLKQIGKFLKFNAKLLFT